MSTYHQLVQQHSALEKKQIELALYEPSDVSDEMEKKYGKMTHAELLRTQDITNQALASVAHAMAELLRKFHQENSCLTPELSTIPASMQVASSQEKREFAKEQFEACVVETEPVVGDATILHSLLISRDHALYADLWPLPGNSNLDEICAKLHDVSDGRFHRQAGEPPNKLAKIAGCALNADGDECEETRSGNFANQWNLMLTKWAGVTAQAQMVTRKVLNQSSASDVILVAVKTDEEDEEDIAKIKGEGFNVVIEWNCNPTEGADRKGCVHAMQIKDATNGHRFLVLSVARGAVEVIGLYWIVGHSKARKVRLAQYDSLLECLKEWLPALIWFTRKADNAMTPSGVPRLALDATDSVLLKQDLYKVKVNGKQYVYKVYDYINRNKAKEDRRWMNWDLVKKNYPPGVTSVAQGSHLGIFSCPFIDSNNLHLPKSKEQYLVVGQALANLHQDNYIHGDVRLANMFFPEDEQKAYLTDFDFARPFNPQDPFNPKYVQGYMFEKLPRHPDAREGREMNIVHDIFSFWECFKVVFVRKDGRPFVDRVWSTMDALIASIRDLAVEPKSIKDGEIDELTVQTAQGI